ncbi:hypothetical protein KM043_005329 [Ampulex compressa]|nr:hypothetical protein KM043_005329 [Ampulex compressa]
MGRLIGIKKGSAKSAEGMPEAREGAFPLGIPLGSVRIFRVRGARFPRADEPLEISSFSSGRKRPAGRQERHSECVFNGHSRSPRRGKGESRDREPGILIEDLCPD